MSHFRSDDTPTFIRAMRTDADLTQVEFARRVGLRQPSLVQTESDARPVSEQVLERVLRVTGYRPSVPLSVHTDEIIGRTRVHGLGALRVFGSVVRGEDGFDSDIGLVVIPSAGTDLSDLALSVHEIEELTGFPTDVVSDTNVPTMPTDVVCEVVPLRVKDTTRCASRPAPATKPRTCMTGRISVPSLS